MTYQPTRLAGLGATTCALTSDATPHGPLGGPAKPRDEFLDPTLCARGNALQRLLEHVLIEMELIELETGKRKRRRKAVDALRWQELIEALLAPLVLAVFRPPPTRRLVLSLSHRRTPPPRYREAVETEVLPRALGYLEDLGVVVVQRGHQLGTATTVAPGPQLPLLMADFGVKVSDVGRRERRELVLLRKSERRAGKRLKQLLDYPDTPETDLIRDQVRQINDHLAAAIIDVDSPRAHLFDTDDRQLRRHFTVLEGQEPRFDQGGRLFGGFWQNMRKPDRKHILINGEPVVELDYSAAFTHIAFAQVGVQPPGGGDLYAVPGLERLSRNQVKAAWNLFYFDQGKGRRTWPETFEEMEWIDQETGEMLSEWALKCSPTTVRKTILAHHPALAPVFCCGSGYRLMWKESKVLIALLLRLRELGAVALPLHDAVLVPRSWAPLVSTLMEEVSMAIIGSPIPVKST